MFMTVVFILLMVLLIITGGATLHMGIFKAHRQDTSYAKRALGGIISYAVSTAVWACMYSYHYLKW